MLNRFGRQAMAAWQELAPTALAQVENPEAFFEEVGIQAEQAWIDLTLQLAGTDTPGEAYFEKVGRIEAAKMQARELVNRDWCRPPQETIETQSTPPAL